MKNRIYYSDGILTALIYILAVFSIFMIYSTWSITNIVFGQSTIFGTVGKQLMFLTVASSLYFIAMKIPYTFYRKMSYFIWFLAVILLLLVFMFKPINDSKSWIPFPYFNFQPSEFAKFAVIVVIANYYHKLFKSKEKITLRRGFITPLLFVLVPSLLIFLQPDPGTMLIIVGISVVLLVVSGLKFGFFFKYGTKLVLLIGALTMMVIAINSVTDGALVASFEEKQSRMLGRFDYKDPCDDFYNEGFQICNSLIAINSGGLFGKGIGNSTQKYLYIPESHTDAIFAVTAEETGFFTVAGIIIVYAAIVLRILYFARRAPDRFSMITCVGIAMLVLVHVFINIGGILNIIPFTGVPLPFFSYGGTFLLLCFGLLGVVQSIIISIKRDGDVNNV